MTVSYMIPAKPTKYRGRMFRSRLEARWAAFFDLLGWNWEYEPSDLGKWSPDFALWGRRRHFPLMVEVKPISAWDRDTARKMADASEDLGCRLILLGLGPNFSNTWGQIGWIGEQRSYEMDWTDGLLSVDMLGRVDIFPDPEVSGSWCPETQLWEVHADLKPASVEHLWTEAANAVQWRAPK